MDADVWETQEVKKEEKKTIYLSCVLVCYSLSFVRIKCLRIRMIPIMEKFLCISCANVGQKEHKYQLD